MHGEGALGRGQGRSRDRRHHTETARQPPVLGVAQNDTVNGSRAAPDFEPTFQPRNALLNRRRKAVRYRRQKPRCGEISSSSISGKGP
jgi:hypothetical protein